MSSTAHSHQLSLQARFVAHRAATGESYRWYAEQTGISRRTLLNIAAGRGRTMYDIGKRLEQWMETYGIREQEPRTDAADTHPDKQSPCRGRQAAGGVEALRLDNSL